MRARKVQKSALGIHPPPKKSPPLSQPRRHHSHRRARFCVLATYIIMTSTKGGFEAFTRLTPAPDVQIDKEKYSQTLRLLALRVPKVSTLVLFVFLRSNHNPSRRLSPFVHLHIPRCGGGVVPRVSCVVECLTDSIVHPALAGQVSVGDEGAEGTGAGHAPASLSHERPRGALRYSLLAS